MCYFIVIEFDLEYGFSEVMGDDYSDDDVFDMEGVSEYCFGNTVVMYIYKILFILIICILII